MVGIIALQAGGYRFSMPETSNPILIENRIM
jgi:hypothetical protein